MRRFVSIILFMVLFCFCFIIGCGSTTENQTDGDTDNIDGDLEDDIEATTDGDVEVEKESDAETSIQPFDYCEPDTPPDETCYAEKRNPDSDFIKLAKAIADKQIAAHQAKDVIWDWGEAVMMIGIKELYRVTGEEKYFNYYKDWIDFHLTEGFFFDREIGSSDTCAPSALAINLYKKTDDEKYSDLLDTAIYYLDNVALRTEEGGLNHLGAWDMLGVTLWVDSLFMFGNVMTGWGELSDNKELLDEFAEQHSIFTDLLQEENGLYKHAYNYAIEQDDNVYWGRGNGWVTVATADHLRARLARGENLPEMQAVMNKHFDAIIPLQDEQTGLWWTIMNRPGETYLETSCAALFAYGMARAWRYGLTDDSVLPVIEKAMQGVNSKIVLDENNVPTVTGTSGPTTVGDFELYKGISQVDDISFGLGAAMLSLIETSGLFEE